MSIRGNARVFVTRPVSIIDRYVHTFAYNISEWCALSGCFSCNVAKLMVVGGVRIWMDACVWERECVFTECVITCKPGKLAIRFCVNIVGAWTRVFTRVHLSWFMNMMRRCDGNFSRLLTKTHWSVALNFAIGILFCIFCCNWNLQPTIEFYTKSIWISYHMGYFALAFFFPDEFSANVPHQQRTSRSFPLHK